MIILQDIKVKDRKTLRLARKHLQSRRDFHRKRAEIEWSEYQSKWNVQRLVEQLKLQLIPEAVSTALIVVSAVFTSAMRARGTGSDEW